VLALGLPLGPARVIGRGVVLLLAFAALATAVTFYVDGGSFVVSRLVSREWQSHTDFETFWQSAVALVHGRDIYETRAALPNLNPPVTSLLLAPTGWLDFWSAYRLFVLASVVLVVASMAAVAAELHVHPAAAITVTVAVLLSSPVLGTLGLGQVYPLLMAGIAAAWVLGRRGRTVWAGVALGVVVALKPALAPLLLLPLVRRRWDTLIAATATGGLATLAGWVAAGWQSLPHWAETVLEHPVQTYVDNAALPGTLARLTAPSAGVDPLVEVPGGAVTGLLLGVVLIAVTTWRVRRPPVAGPDTALWAVTAAALLASPLSWHNYLMLLAPGVLALVVRGRWPVAALLLSLALIGMEWQWAWDGPDGRASGLALSLYCAILLAYWAALLPLAAAGPPDCAADRASTTDTVCQSSLTT
jgi:glycosyl transferase family 87